MSEHSSRSQQSELSQRLKRLPGQLLLALVNATAVLVILAAILVLVAIGRAEDVAGRVSATVTEALAAHLPGKPGALREEIAGLRSDLAAFRSNAGTSADAAAARLDARIAGLEAQLGELQGNLQQLSAAGADITRKTAEEAGAAIGQSLGAVLACRQPALADASAQPPAAAD
ncbi:hypothetical protein ACFOGJ_27040 [Marinibaculum pumilum]|uniref:Uncharacterized protein n=1 Tax=Marinibaculum pumilum TaxID=1766165 RepID=A0ABV7L945_9PROT